MNRAERRRQNKLKKKFDGTPYLSKDKTLPTKMKKSTKLTINNALQYHNEGKIKEAKDIYEQILIEEPLHFDALHLFGVAYYQQENYSMAIKFINKALRVIPDNAAALSNLGSALNDSGQFTEAVKNLQKAIKINSNFAEAHNNLGNGLNGLGKLTDAEKSFRTAIKIKPTFSDAYHNLGNTLYESGQVEEAFENHKTAIDLQSTNDSYWVSLAETCKHLSPHFSDLSLCNILGELLERKILCGRDVMVTITNLLMKKTNFKYLVTRSNDQVSLDSLQYLEMVKYFSRQTLFLKIMKVSPIYNLKIENLLILLRQFMSLQALRKNQEEQTFPFEICLAIHCFTNEYIYPETDEEISNILKIENKILGFIKQNRKIPVSLFTTLAAYRPLSNYKWAKTLKNVSETEGIDELLRIQIIEVYEEQSLHSKIQKLTPIKNKVSKAVQGQYEENPYPRWINPNVVTKKRTIGDILRGSPLRFDLGSYNSPKAPEILVAGCGTGQHAIDVAARYEGAQVLALDLSISSLSYGLRKSIELGFDNITFAQGDIMHLGDIKQSFDLIESVGVLHHLETPLSGWKILKDLLRPKGFMKIGLYSELARRDITFGRSQFSKRKETVTNHEMREFRQQILRETENGDLNMKSISTSGDFFNLSEFRDLLFHVQESCFTLDQIDEAIKSLNLKFIGFELEDQKVLNDFDTLYPDGPSRQSLSLWEKFEKRKPSTFRNMYQFWCQKS